MIQPTKGTNISTPTTTTTAPGDGFIDAATAREITGSFYMDRRECAAFMCVSEKFLATHLQDGPQRMRAGSKILYRLTDVENWMRQQQVRR